MAGVTPPVVDLLSNGDVTIRTYVLFRQVHQEDNRRCTYPAVGTRAIKDFLSDFTILGAFGCNLAPPEPRQGLTWRPEPRQGPWRPEPRQGLTWRPEPRQGCYLHQDRGCHYQNLRALFRQVHQEDNRRCTYPVFWHKSHQRLSLVTSQFWALSGAI